MTRCLTVTVALAVALVFASRAARAYPYTDPTGGGAVGVVWGFDGTVELNGDFSSCCSLGVGNGDHVHGTITIFRPYPTFGTDIATVAVQFPHGGIQADGNDSCCFNGAPGSGQGDRLGEESLVFDYSFLGLQPGWDIYWTSPNATFQLFNADGTAWGALNPRTGDIFPDDPPPLDKFQTAQFVANEMQPSYGSGPYTGGYLTVTIDRWLPEPRPAGLAALATLLCLLARSSAGATRRAGRGSAR